MLYYIHTTSLKLSLRTFKISPVESLYVDVHDPCLGARREKLSLQCASKIKPLPKHPTHDAVFKTTPSYFVLSPWCIKQPNILLELMHVYKELFMIIRARYRDYIPVYVDGSRDGNYVACAIVFPADTLISMRLPDS